MTLFNQTSAQAGQAAARHNTSRRLRILDLLTQQPMALWELADAMNVFDHQISGRLTELARDGLIEPTGDRRTRPGTNCQAEVWRLKTTRPQPTDRDRQLDAMGIPLTLTIDGELFDRAGDLILPSPCTQGEGQGRGAQGRGYDAPGLPYTRRPTGGGPHLIYRVELIECPGCGRPLKMIEEKSASQTRKVYRCGTPDCSRTWFLMLLTSPGSPPTPSLVM